MKNMAQKVKTKVNEKTIRLIWEFGFERLKNFNYLSILSKRSRWILLIQVA